jgi:hypothetical protein
VAWLFIVPLALLLTVVGLLYVPGVFNAVVQRALPWVDHAAGMQITINRAELSFPLHVAVDGLTVTTPTVADTMLTAADARASVGLLPLLRGNIAVDNAVVRHGFYQMGGADSLYVAADIDSVGAAALINLSRNSIDVSHAALDGARLKVILGPDTTSAPVDTTSVEPWLITLRNVSLRRVDYNMTMALAAGVDTVSASLADAALNFGTIRVADTICINAGTLTIDVPRALYAAAGSTVEPGLNPTRLSLSDISAQVDSFAMQGLQLRVPVSRLHAAEQCGLRLDASGVFAMDSTMLYANDFRLLTTYSKLRLSAVMGLDTIPELTPLMVDATAEVGTEDVGLAYPLLKPLLKQLPAQVPLKLRAKLSGTMARLEVDTLAAEMQRTFSLKGSGSVGNFTSTNLMRDMIADVQFTGKLIDASTVNRLKILPDGVNVPSLALTGNFTALTGNYSGAMRATTGSGRLALDATYRGTAPDYTLQLRADAFPVSAFVPDMGIGTVTADLAVKGRGFNPMKSNSQFDVTLSVDHVDYQNRPVRNIALDASLHGGHLIADVNSEAPDADLTVALDATLHRDLISWNLDGDIRALDLRALGVTDSLMAGSMRISSTGCYAPRTDSIAADASIASLHWQQGSALLTSDAVSATLLSSAGSGTRAKFTDSRGNLTADFTSPSPLMTLASRFSRASTLAMSMAERRNVVVDSLQRVLPQFTFRASALSPSIISQYLAADEFDFHSLNFTAVNDTSIRANATLLGFRSGTDIRVDTLTADLHQKGDALLLDVDMGNRPGTFDEFAQVCLRGGMRGNRGMFYLKQQNLKGETGYSLGFNAEVADSLITIKLDPLNPVIAYKNWTVNDGNYVEINPYTYHIDANLDAAGDASRVQLFTSHDHDNEADADEDDVMTPTNDLTLRVTDISLADWLKLNPFAPPVEGTVSADIKLDYEELTTINGSGTINLRGLTYGKQRVGDFDLGVDLSSSHGVVNADVSLLVDGVKTITATGALNDSTKSSPFLLDMEMVRMPLAVVNPFLPSDMARMSGALSGTMKVDGSLTQPIFNGTLHFDSAAVTVPMIGSGFRFAETPVEVDSSRIRFTDFSIYGSNDNPLRINGNVDVSSLTSPQVNLSMEGSNMMLVNSKKKKGVDVYGKAYADLNATVQGNMRFMRVDVDASLLPQTNVTYIMSDAQTQIALQNTSNLVKFVNFNDTTTVQSVDSVDTSSMMLVVNASLRVRQGSTITVDLSADGQNRAQVKGEGTLDYSLTPSASEGRMTGRFTINSGFVRYSLPVISEKLFNFTPGSYIAFNGDMLNPVLAVNAVDEVRANVTRDGENSRLVNFDVALDVTGTLEQMNVAFDLSTDDDITVQNELQSMSSEQRANQAMNLLLYGVYSGSGTNANANLSGNALYSFLTSQLNTWAAGAIKGVDLSFGMDQYDRTLDGSTATTTNYSYTVSKSLLDDRFKIVVGGKYSTDANVDENFAQNLISDISFEYLLNDAGSMYVRLFRHTGYESILEGEITQTGVGFVVKRKIRRLIDIFRF